MTLWIRAYNVLHGDCLLISWDEIDGKHHAWVDFGNFHNDANAVFATVYADVLKRTRGELDLAVITHRHLDHLEGFSSLRHSFAEDFHIKRLWHSHVTAAADDLFHIADNQMAELLPATATDAATTLGRIYRNNLQLTTKKRMDDILTDLGADSNHALHRQTDLQATGAIPPGMQRMQVEILAPEEDSSVYLEPLEQTLTSRDHLGTHFRQAAGRVRRGARDTSEFPLDASKEGVRGTSPFWGLADFARLRRKLRTGGLDILAAVNKTRNNTSLVMRWTYEGHRILLTGDAEETSWEIMRREHGDLEADTVKVGHHGSINASPEWSYTNVMPVKQIANRALFSCDPSRFTGENEVPKEEVLAGWRSRVERSTKVKRTDSVDLGDSVAFRITV
ncbi:hypothetical protein ACFLRH_02110 [Actinomycetota bacterium]